MHAKIYHLPVFPQHCSFSRRRWWFDVWRLETRPLVQCCCVYLRTSDQTSVAGLCVLYSLCPSALWGCWGDEGHSSCCPQREHLLHFLFEPCSTSHLTDIQCRRNLWQWPRTKKWCCAWLTHLPSSNLCFDHDSIITLILTSISNWSINWCFVMRTWISGLYKSSSE